jgi:hypothetical protein
MSRPGQIAQVVMGVQSLCDYRTVNDSWLAGGLLAVRRALCIIRAHPMFCKY